MDFNLDDPLADLVSDNSNNDSFFETTRKPTPSKSKEDAKPKSGETQKTLTSNKTMEDLFGISSSTNTTKPQAEVKLGSTPPSSISAKKPVISRTAPSKSEDLFNDGDIIADLGFDPKKPKATKSSILDDLLTSIVDTPKNSQPSTKYARPLTAGGTKNISRQSTETTDYSGAGTSQGTSLPTTRPKTSVGRRQSINSTNDPLGLFATPTAGSTKDQSFESKLDSAKETTPKTKKKIISPDWLGLDFNAKKPEPKDISSVETQILQVTHSNMPEIIASAAFPHQEYSQRPNQNLISMAAANIEAQSAIQTLNQQESQVMMAAQLRNQEVALLEMQKKQQELLSQQEFKFNELLQKQITRQNHLEVTIKSQQERINSHIQMLMTQPPLISNTNEDLGIEINKYNETNRSTDKKQNQQTQIQLEHEVKRLELEKLRLEDLISNINANHEKEMEFIDNSHKKQIQLLENSLETVQKRLQTDINSLQEFYGKKLSDLEVEKQKLIVAFEEIIKNTKESHEKSISELKAEYETSIKNLKADHKSTIEAIRESKLMEFTFIQDNTSYLQVLRNASNNLENVSGNLQTLRDEMNNKIDLEYKQKEEMLTLREKKLNDLERRLKISEEASEREQARLIELVTTLEIQLQKLSKDSADEQWILKQKLSTLEAERSAFEREKEFIREQLSRDERKLEEFKQAQLEEYQRLMQKLQDEKNLLAIEKSKFETTKKLEQNNDFNKSKTEIDIAIKVAKDATKQADLERERFLKLQRELDIRKRELVDQENEIRSKGEELDSEIFKLKSKEKKIQEALQRQKYVEQSLSAKIQFLQDQTKVLSERETQLSQERLVLSKERIELKDFKRKAEMNKCSLCKIGERSTAISNIITGNDMFPDSENYNEQFNSGIYLNDVLNFENYGIARNIDELFDKDITDSLKKMEQLNKTFQMNVHDDNDDNILIQNIDPNPSQVLLDPDFSIIELNARQLLQKE